MARYQPVDPAQSFPDLEQQVLARWRERDVFRESMRRRLGWSKANATEVIATLEARGLVQRRRLVSDRRAAAVDLLPAGRALVEDLFPGHASRVSTAFSALDEQEKRSLAEICRKLAA